MNYFKNEGAYVPRWTFRLDKKIPIWQLSNFFGNSTLQNPKKELYNIILF